MSVKFKTNELKNISRKTGKNARRQRGRGTFRSGLARPGKRGRASNRDDTVYWAWAVAELGEAC
jgi:hypothetical protein